MYSLISGFLTAKKISICQLPCAGSYSHRCWGNYCYLLCTFCCLLKYDCYCCLANLGCHCCFWDTAKGSFLELLISAFSFTSSVLECKTHKNNGSYNIISCLNNSTGGYLCRDETRKRTSIYCCHTRREIQSKGIPIRYVPWFFLVYIHTSFLIYHNPQVCIDVVVQRLGDATAAGMYKLLFSTLNGKTSTVSLYALPVCVNTCSCLL